MNFSALFRSRFAIVLLIVLAFSLWGCATPRQGPELPPSSIGVAAFTQPQSVLEMLAGNIPDDTPRIQPKKLTELDATLAEVLRTETKRQFAPMETFLGCRNAKAPGQTTGRASALRYWIAVGNCMKVDFLLVPHAIDFRERDGGEAGVIHPASVTMNFYLIDVRNSLVTTRSHFEETQIALSDNLLEANKFISRRGRWISALELAREGMVKAVTKDMNL